MTALIKGYSLEYAAIKAFYGQRCAARSKVPLMNHIDEGLVIIRQLAGTCGCGLRLLHSPTVPG
ncbi:hypothetical protein LP414_27390 [Polaromonas sp. P1(28)-13]|nr:hypothetical protein LP414_27390 [Polaromonas sp. P1(28)-13]